MKRLTKKILNIAFGGASQSFIRRLNYLAMKLKGGYFAINQLDKQLEQYVNYDNGYKLLKTDGQADFLYFK